MYTKLTLALFILFFAFAALAEVQKDNFKIPAATGTTDLIHETQSLTLQEEAGVQVPNPPSKFFITILGGTMQPKFLSVESHGHVVNYQFDKSLPVFTAQFSHLAFNKWGR